MVAGDDFEYENLIRQKAESSTEKLYKSIGNAKFLFENSSEGQEKIAQRLCV